MSSSGSSERSRLRIEFELGVVPRTWTLCLSSRAERAWSLSAVGICDLYATPPSSFPLTDPVEEIVAVETLLVVTSLTKPV